MLTVYCGVYNIHTSKTYDNDSEKARKNESIFL